MTTKNQDTQTKSRATRTSIQIVEQQGIDAARERAQAQASGNTTPTPVTTTTATPANGFDEPASGGSIMQGGRGKFVDGRWTDGDGAPLPSPLLVMGTATCVQMWKEKRATTIVKEAGKDLPDLDELNAKIPESEWEKGLNGQPEKPWKKNWVAYLLDPKTAGVYTFINSTKGQKIAIETLESKVRTMRALRGSAAVPVVELGSKPMPTEFGQKMRPHFEIIGWRALGGGGKAAPQIEHKPTEPSGQMPGKPVEPVSLSEEMNDKINF
jgi:hypothetical protein